MESIVTERNLRCVALLKSDWDTTTLSLCHCDQGWILFETDTLSSPSQEGSNQARCFTNTGAEVQTTCILRELDADLTGQFRWTQVYAKRRARWELVAQQSTRIGDAVPSSSFPSEGMDNVAAQSSATSMNNEESRVREVENDLTNALLHGDASTLNRLYAADYVHTGPDAVLSGKSDRIAEFRSGARQFTYLKRGDVQIRMYRIAAVVTDVDTVQGMFKGKDISGRARVMRVWVKQPEGWQLVAAHATALAP